MRSVRGAEEPATVRTLETKPEGKRNPSDCYRDALSRSAGSLNDAAHVLTGAPPPPMRSSTRTSKPWKYVLHERNSAVLHCESATPRLLSQRQAQSFAMQEQRLHMLRDG